MALTKLRHAGNWAIAGIRRPAALALALPLQLPIALGLPVPMHSRKVRAFEENDKIQNTKMGEHEETPGFQNFAVCVFRLLSTVTVDEQLLNTEY